MTIPLPSSLPVSSSWGVVDWLDRSWSSGPAGTDGVALITLPPLPDFERWQLSHMVVSCTSSTASRVRFYLDGVSDVALREGSDKGNFDVGDWPMGLWVPPGRSLLARWTGCSAGAVATLAVQATILRRT